MKDFANWCIKKELVDVFEDGTVSWKETNESANKTDGGRNLKKDLSDDYKDYCHQMGTVWPFKLLGKSKFGKQKSSK